MVKCLYCDGVGCTSGFSAAEKLLMGLISINPMNFHGINECHGGEWGSDSCLGCSVWQGNHIYGSEHNGQSPLRTTEMLLLSSAS